MPRLTQSGTNRSYSSVLAQFIGYIGGHFGQRVRRGRGDAWGQSPGRHGVGNRLIFGVTWLDRTLLQTVE